MISSSQPTVEPPGTSGLDQCLQLNETHRKIVAVHEGADVFANKSIQSRSRQSDTDLKSIETAAIFGRHQRQIPKSINHPVDEACRSVERYVFCRVKTRCRAKSAIVFLATPYARSSLPATPLKECQSHRARAPHHLKWRFRHSPPAACMIGNAITRAEIRQEDKALTHRLSSIFSHLRRLDRRRNIDFFHLGVPSMFSHVLHVRPIPLYTYIIRPN